MLLRTLYGTIAQSWLAVYTESAKEPGYCPNVHIRFCLHLWGHMKLFSFLLSGTRNMTFSHPFQVVSINIRKRLLKFNLSLLLLPHFLSQSFALRKNQNIQMHWEEAMVGCSLHWGVATINTPSDLGTVSETTGNWPRASSLTYRCFLIRVWSLPLAQ